MLVYSQRSGELRRFGSNALIGSGYSGNGAGKNNPAAEAAQGTGPIPRGFWRIGTAYDSANTGPRTIPLYKLDGEPGDDTDSQTGRSAFRIHGDSNTRPGEASRGCIILPRIIRETIIAAPDEILWVVE